MDTKKCGKSLSLSFSSLTLDLGQQAAVVDVLAVGHEAGDHAEVHGVEQALFSVFFWVCVVCVCVQV